MINVNANMIITNSYNHAAGGYSPAALDVFTNIGGSLSDPVKDAIAAFVDAEVLGGRWTNHLDVFQLWGTALGSEAQGLRNWIQDDFHATNPKPETATINGYDMSGSGVGGIITGYNPTNGAKWTATNAMHGIYVNRRDSTGDQRTIMGNGSGAASTLWTQRTVASRLDFNNVGMNNVGTLQISGYPNGFNQGLYTSVLEFSVSNYRQRVYENGVSIGTPGAPAASTELNFTIRVGGRGDSSNPWDGVLSVYFAGAGNGFNVADFYTNLNTLLIALGVKI